MRKIDSVIIHCSATKAGMDFSVADIDRWHRARGMNGIGYHYVVRLDGTVEKGNSHIYYFCFYQDDDTEIYRIRPF